MIYKSFTSVILYNTMRYEMRYGKRNNEII